MNCYPKVAGSSVPLTRLKKSSDFGCMSRNAWHTKEPLLPIAWVPGSGSEFRVWTTMLCHYIAKISLNVMNNVEPQQTEFDRKYSMFSMECIFKEDPSTKIAALAFDLMWNSVHKLNVCRP